MWHSKACYKRYVEFLDVAVRADSYLKIDNEEINVSVARRYVGSTRKLIFRRRNSVLWKN